MFLPKVLLVVFLRDSTALHHSQQRSRNRRETPAVGLALSQGSHELTKHPRDRLTSLSRLDLRLLHEYVIHS